MDTKHKIWVEKYRPQNLTEYVFHDEQLHRSVEHMLIDQTIPHLLLSGCSGSGKTTLAKILVKELGILDEDLMVINASDENSVDVMRDKIKSFITTFAMGKFKVINLEESDYLSPNSQAVLRQLMEEFSDTSRFILTCNYENKIIPAIKSRCQQFRFVKPDRDKVAEFVANILVLEKIKFTLDQLDSYVAVGYPDIRKIINLLQQNSIDGKLLPITQTETSDYKFQLLDLIETGDWFEARKLACSQVSSEEWEDVFKFLYENLYKSPSFATKEKWEAGIVVIADHLYKHSLVADPEINAAAMFIRLGQL